MFLPNLFTKRKKPASLAVVDFGTTAVKVAVVDLTTFNPTVLGLAKDYYKNGTVLSGLVANLDDFLSTLRSAIRRASLTGGFTPQDFVFSLSSEFIKSITVDLKIQRETDGKIKGGEKHRIEEEINRLVFAEAATEFERVTGNPSPDFKIVEKRVVQLTSLDGVLLEGFDSILEKNFKAEVGLSFISQQTDRLLTYVIHTLKRRLAFTSAQMINVVTLLKRGYGNFSAVVVDGGGQVTDVCLVDHGRILGIRTLPLGGKDLTEELAEKFNLSWEQAEEKKLAEAAYTPEMGDFILFWWSSLERALADLVRDSSWPSFKVYLFGGASKPHLLKPSLEDFLKAKPNSNLRALNFEYLEPKIYKNVVSIKGELVNQFEAVLATVGQVPEWYVSNNI